MEASHIQHFKIKDYANDELVSKQVFCFVVEEDDMCCMAVFKSCVVECLMIEIRTNELRMKFLK